MKKSVYNYICSHPDANIHDIASAVNSSELEALKIVIDLHGEGYITLRRIIPLSPENFASCHYSATSKQYPID